MSDDKLYGNVLIKAIAILDYLKNNEKAPNLNEIASHLKISMGTASKIMHTMKSLELAIQDPMSGRYLIGTRLIGYGQKALNQIKLEDILMPYLENIYNEFEETMHLGILQNDNVVYVYKKEAKQAVMLRSRIGDSLSLSTSAMGKAVLATKTYDEVNEYLDRYPLHKITNKTIVDRDKFLKELERVKKNGYAIDDEENENGVCCIGICFMCGDTIFGTMSISVPIYRLTSQKKEAIINSLLDIKSTIEQKL